MVKNYRVYKMKYGLMKYELEFENNSAPSSYHKNEVSLALSEAILKNQGFTRIGEIEVKAPMVIEREVEETDSEED